MCLKECKISKINWPNKNNKKNYKLMNQNKIFKFQLVQIIIKESLLLPKICLQLLKKNTVRMCKQIVKLICL